MPTARREAGGFLAALLLYGLFYTGFFFQSFLSGNYIAPSDSFDFGVAAYLSPVSLWTEGMYSGYPIAADPQAQTWYPVLRLFRALGVDWNVFLIAAYVIASSTGFLFVRRLTASALAGAFSGFVIGFSGMMLGYIGNFNQIHAFAWVPLALYGLQLIREGLHRPGTAVTALGIALMWLAGHPQVAVYTMYLTVGVIVGGLFVDRPSRAAAITRVAWSCAALLIGLMLAAIALLPMLELGNLSIRADSAWALYASSALPPRELLTLLMPLAFGGFWTGEGRVPYLGDTGDTAYAGLLPVALALAAPFVVSPYRADARLWMALTMIEIVLCLGAATPLGTLFFYAPGYSSFQAPLRHLFLVSLGLAVASGLVFAELIRRCESRRLVAGAVSVATLLAGTGFALFAWRTEAVRALIEREASYVRWAIGWPLALGVVLTLVILGARRSSGRRSVVVALGMLLIAAQVGDLMAVHYRMPGRRFIYADIVRSEAVLHPKMAALRRELERSAERVLATDGSQNPFLLPNLTRAWGIPAASGTGSLAIQRYVDVAGITTSGSVTPETLSAAHRGVDLFAIGYALVRRDSSLINDLERQGDRWRPVETIQYDTSDPDTEYMLFRNLRARPRAWCVSDVVDVESDQALKAIRTGTLPDNRDFDPSRTALFEPEPGALGGWARNKNTAAAPGRVVADHNLHQYLVASDTPCMLVLSEVHYPWWRASVDGRPVGTDRLNHAMLGVEVPPGSHVIRLWIAPISVWIGAAISGTALLLLGALPLLARLRVRRAGA